MKSDNKFVQVDKKFRAMEEASPGPKWADLFQALWPEYKAWFLIQGDAARPTYGESLKQLKRHMPELVPTYRSLSELAGGSDSAARLLSLYCPPPYLSGCTQAVWTGDNPLLVRNYDYNPSRLEGVLMKTCWNGQKVIAMSDALWGVLDGINESGLAVSLSFGGRVDVGKGFGIPLILRYILEFCEDTPSAIAVLKRVPTHMSYNITVVDQKQNFATVYVTPDKPAVVRPVPFATNHQGRIEWPRHAWATATLERESAVQAIFSDPDQSAHGLLNCFLEAPVFNSAYQRGFGTLYTAVYRTEKLSVDIIWPKATWQFDMDNFVEQEMLVRYDIEAASDQQHGANHVPLVEEW